MNKIYKFGFIGTGAYGSALANILTHNNLKTIMYGINDDEINDINNGYNKKFFGEKKFDNNHLITATKDLEYVLDNSENIVLAVPSFVLSSTLSKMKELRPQVKWNIINIAKGFETQTRTFFSEFIKKEMKESLNNLSTLLGPSFAIELFEKNKTIINIFGDSKKYNNEVISYFNNDYFKIYPIDDPFSAELFAALKNVLAIGCGILSEVSNSKNTFAAFLTTGVKEILMIYGKIAKKKKYKLVFDYATFGDTVLTCSNDKSRNFSYGKFIAKNGIESANKEFQGTIEGKEAAKVLVEILNIYRIKTKVFKGIISVLANKISPKEIDLYITK
ncbi:glycerol-3-phosphate dehydrogenase (NAD(P)+) [Mycoplasmopsis canis PG 14]|uniref:Glycerol-3-phosphate dehydrogenase n=1 Tax=Mycoplasmopsis canis TaxID=29555 RepID=A0A449ART7_9BACT|nr:NAD(P)H-dependent glycerol-3-phosphate dehydrogenase [Mycoplasmopsis canis]AMD81442.1 glycerol-3-phosphate dehydrogenase [Mycoplasmopsis canis PG 14]EIE39537.1 glycerol-3-phosphate dehydrogenase (NAD(P)+) [Mycoplasmopsis canis PG 14]VEU69072.1 glycerol-3-phosphate dehydrogenase [Mycoplasmopsis canis]